jgi:hypothetical protein
LGGGSSYGILRSISVRYPQRSNDVYEISMIK